MSHISDEDLRDELLTIFEEKEGELKLHEQAMKKIEDEGMMKFEKRAIAIKNRVAEDVNVPDEKLEEVYLGEIEKMRKELVAEVQREVDSYIKNLEEKSVKES